MKHIYHRMLKSINCRTFNEVSEYFSGLKIRAASVSNILRTGTIPSHMIDYMKKKGVDIQWLVHGNTGNSGHRQNPAGEYFAVQPSSTSPGPRVENTSDTRLFQEMPL